MEKQKIEKDKGVVGLEEDKAYFTSGTLVNIISTDVDKLIELSINTIEGGIYRSISTKWKCMVF